MVFDYPIASGALHVGHARFYVTADVIARFKRMRGFNVFFSLGLHATGIDCIAIYERARGDPENAIRYGIPIEDSEKLNSLIVAEKCVEKTIVKSLQRLGCPSIFYPRISAIDAPQNRS